MKYIKKQCGYSYLELMIAIALVALLLIMALPSYKSSQIEQRRVAGQASLLDIRDKWLQFRQINGITLANQITSFDWYNGKNDWYISIPGYNVTFRNAYIVRDTSTSINVYTLANRDVYPISPQKVFIATPIEGDTQFNDGVLCITESGYRYWSVTGDNCVFFNDGSSWGKPFLSIAQLRELKWYGE